MNFDYKSYMYQIINLNPELYEIYIKYKDSMGFIENLESHAEMIKYLSDNKELADIFTLTYCQNALKNWLFQQFKRCKYHFIIRQKDDKPCHCGCICEGCENIIL